MSRRNCRHRRSRRNRDLAPAPQPLALEPLERRTMLCAADIHLDPPAIDPVQIAAAAASRSGSTAEGGPDGGQIDIIWANRGVTSGANNDRFSEVFGANADAARAVVDAVIDSWERVIVSFNYANGAPDVYSLYVSMDSVGQSLGGVGTASHYNGGRPDIGYAILGRGLDATGDGLGDGVGWFIDPTPNEHSEFVGNITNAYTGTAQPAGNPAFGKNDFYTVVAAELTHCMGLTNGVNNFQNSPYLSATTIPDTSDGGGVGFFWTFAGPSISHLMTTYGGGTDFGVPIHTAGPGVPVTVGSQEFIGADDVGNAAYGPSQRMIVSNTARLILQDAYGYTTRNPAEFGTFYAVLNEATGQVIVRGGGGESVDNLTISLDGTDVVFSVDVTDIPGTGHLPGAGNLGPFVTRYPAADVDSILVDTGFGNDTIRINGTESPLTVDAGFGNDTIFVGGDDIDSNLLADVVINGEEDTDRINFDDRNDEALNDDYTLSATQLRKATFGANRRVSFGTVESLALNGSDQPNRYDIIGLAAGTMLAVTGGDGNETFNIGNGHVLDELKNNVTLNGGSGTDDMIYRDMFDDAPGGDRYDLLTNSLTKDSTGANRRVNFSNMESLHLRGSPQASAYYVLGVAANLPVTIDAGEANDTMLVGATDVDRDIKSNVTLNGSGGADLLSFNDIADDAGEDEYTVTQTTFSKPSRSFRYGTIESIILSGSPQNDTLRLIGSPVGTTIELHTRDGNDSFVLGNNDLDTIRTAFVLDGEGGTDALGILDVSDAGADTYTLTSTTFAKTADGGGMRQFAQFEAMESISLLANPDGGTFNIQSTGAGTPVTILGNDGADTFNIGTSGSVAGILSRVYVDGFDGADRLSYNDGASTTLNEYTVDGYLVRRSNVADVEARVEEMTLNCGDAADTVNVLKTNAGIPLTVNGQGGADAFYVGGGNWDANVGAPVTINGNAAADTLNINDTADTGADAYTLTSTQATKNTAGSQPISFATMETLVLDAGTGGNTIDVNGTFNGDVRIRGNGGADRINVNDNFGGTFVNVDGGAGLDNVYVNGDASGTAAVQFDSSQALGLLLVHVGGTARLNAGGGKVLTVTDLTVAGGVSGAGVLDLTDNAMIIDYAAGSPLASVQALLKAGYNGGAWNGAGINSSAAAAGTATALGVAEATDLFSAFPAIFQGRSVDNTSILIKHTFYGDANLDGTVTLADFNRYAANFGLTSGARWSQGDFLYNGNVFLEDFNRLATNFGATETLPQFPFTRGGKEDREPIV